MEALTTEDTKNILTALTLCLRLIDLSEPDTFDEPLTEEQTQELYKSRNKAIHNAVFWATKLGYKAGYTVHEPISDLIPVPNVGYDSMGHKVLINSVPIWNKRFGVVAIIELPTGQVAWHIDSADLCYDGHSTEEKAKRLRAFVEDSEKDIFKEGITDAVLSPVYNSPEEYISNHPVSVHHDVFHSNVDRGLCLEPWGMGEWKEDTVQGILIPGKPTEEQLGQLKASLHTVDVASVAWNPANYAPLQGCVTGTIRVIPNDSLLPTLCPVCANAIEQCTCGDSINY